MCDSVLSKRLLKPEIGGNKLLKVATVAYELNLINNSLQVYWGCGFVWNCLVCTIDFFFFLSVGLKRHIITAMHNLYSENKHMTYSALLHVVVHQMQS